MKIIKPGNVPELKEYEATCTHCRCEFAFQRCEAKSESTCRNEQYLKIACPTCKRDVWVQI